MTLTLKGDQPAAFDAAARWWETPYSKRPQIFHLNGGAGVGKAQPLTAKIATPTGFKPMGDVKEGDYVIGSDGKPTKVLGVYPQGVREAVKISFRDGSETVCDLDHIWAVEGSKRKGRTEKTARELLESGVKYSSGDSKWKIPLCEPVEFSAKRSQFPAYVIGVLIGDASLTGSVIDLCAPEKHIADKVSNLLGDEYELAGRLCGTVQHYTVKDMLCGNGSGTNRLKRYLKAAGLCVKSMDKFIPDEYLYSTVEERKAMLQGLMDTDGTSEGNRILFSTSSLRLAQNVRTLVQSLGGTGIVRTYEREGASTEYIVNVKVGFNPFTLPRKAANWKFSSKNPPSRYIVSIEKAEPQEMQCIKVAASDSLYLTDEYIVTHNTTVAKKFEDFCRVSFMTLSGKAALVMRQKGIANATTIHSAIYKLDGLSEGQPSFMLNPDSDVMRYTDLVVVDECSMVDEVMGNDLLSFCKPILVLGDYNQLPPPKDSPSFFKQFPVDFNMSKILRQGEDSPIIELAYQALSNGKLVPGKYGDCNVYSSKVKEATVQERMLFADQVLCGKNATRSFNNLQMREWKKHFGLPFKHCPVVGDRLICLRNDHKKGVLNGEQFEVVELLDKDLGDIASMNVRSMDSGSDMLIEIDVPYHWFNGTEGNLPFYTRENFDKFTYAETLTVHKSQGSQWNKVAVLDESGAFRENRRQHLYTAITRAAKSVDIFL